MRTSRTMSSSVTGLRSSGSMTRSRARRMSSRAGATAASLATRVLLTSGKDTGVTWLGLVRRNLLRRRVRALLTAAGVALGVALIVALLSISAGAKRTAADLIHVGRADFGLFQSGVSDATRSLLPVRLEREVARDPGVAQTARIFLLVTTVNGRASTLVFGFSRDEFPARR